MIAMAVLCARYRNDRCPGKHWLEIDGLPVWHYAARALLASVRARRVGVAAISTDDPRMLEDAVEMGLFPVKRPKRMCSSKASIHEALQHTVQEYEKDAQCSNRIKFVAFVPANVPTITPKLVGECFRLLRALPGATATMTVRSVTEYPQWMWRQSGTYLRRLQSCDSYRVQDMPKLFVATGTCQVVRREVLMACRVGDAFRWLGGRILPVPDPGAVEVHTRKDFLLAKTVMEG